ncbi:sensor histidine kinase [Oceanobacter mangrovi]|uniref:sensor histidine kinase n=1 Tax=Oceanobacter mangrovi TaxID=2862510 RepID=UPI001C8ECB29|nr:ATP-binding protein [Oceanobacter mangrovi]
MSHSIQQTLNRRLLAATCVFALLASLVSGWLSFNEAREIQDNLLQQFASLIRIPVNQQTDPDPDFSSSEDALLWQPLDNNPANPLALPNALAEGFHTLRIDELEWRVFVYQPAHSQQRYAVSQQTEARDEVAWSNSLNTLIPMLLLVPVLLLIVRLVIRRSFAPLQKLARQLDQQGDDCLAALSKQPLATEIAPFIASINRLLQRLQQSIDQQRRFVADAAHELRTPVAGLSLLADNLSQVTTPEQLQSRLPPLQTGLKRIQLLVSQLLDLARLQGQGSQAIKADLQLIVQDVIAELYPLAEQKTIDLGMLVNEPLQAKDIAGVLRILIHNAIDNAIRYSPVGSQIDISLFSRDGMAVILVADNGPGIPTDELQAVLEPFYRVGVNSEPGNGLGLAISNEIAKRLGGSLTLSNRPTGGLTLQYCQPLASSLD